MPRLLNRALARAADVLVMAVLRAGDARLVVVRDSSFEEYVETHEIETDPEAMAAIAEGTREADEGSLEAYEDVRRELGYAECSDTGT